MLSNDKCIQVAEKVWKWKTPKNNDWRWQEHIKEEVNSWLGFGRTVEAMGVLHYSLLIDGGPPLGCAGPDAGKGTLDLEFWKDSKHRSHAHVIRIFNSVGESEYEWEPRDMIEATHLTALEAIDAEGS